MGNYVHLKKKFMELYKELKRRDLVINEKDYQELVYNRQIKVNDQVINDPKHKLDTTKTNRVKIGILQIENIS